MLKVITRFWSKSGNNPIYVMFFIIGDFFTNTYCLLGAHSNIQHVTDGMLD